MKALLVLALCATAGAAELRFEVRHERALRDRPGIVVFDDLGVTYRQSLTAKQQKEPERRRFARPLEVKRWTYGDIQQIWVAPHKLVLTTYTDRSRLLGVDREYELFAAEGVSFESVYPFLRDKLDQRFVAAVVDGAVHPIWQIPVKRLGAFRGSEGLLLVGADHVIFSSAEPNASRTWRLQDIENVSSSGPFQLTLTTFERALTQYGSLKGFNFQLKERLDPKRYELLWRRLNRDKGLSFLQDIQERTTHLQ